MTRLRWLRRRWWALVAAAVGVPLLALAFKTTQPVRHRASGLFVVVSGDNRSPSEAQKLAITYAELVGADNAVMSRVASLTNLPQSVVESHLTLGAVPNTQLLQASYDSSSGPEAVNAINALSQAITGARPASTTINPGSLLPVSLPVEATTVSGRSGTALPVAVVIGFILGIALVVGLEYGDPRLDSPDQLQDLMPCPVLPIAASRVGVLSAAAVRWRERVEGRPRRLGLLPVDRTSKPACQKAADLVQNELDEFERQVRVSHDSVPDPHGLLPSFHASVHMICGDPLDGEGKGELLAVESDTTVLVVVAGTRRRKVTAALERLDALLAPPDWCLFAETDFGRATPPARPAEEVSQHGGPRPAPTQQPSAVSPPSPAPYAGATPPSSPRT